MKDYKTVSELIEDTNPIQLEIVLTWMFQEIWVLTKNPLLIIELTY